ncbi:MAG: 16S rRNA (cytosine(1402)-N(4))-methyltransferase RsmH [Lachnospiraceae bacterium]|nr:16S rRNA (cytosine(1402)-N(4))-methyltransferase RsmH [Lachnospiraceae bacterium]
MFNHIPVLLNETIDGLNVNEDGIYVDATLGGGGHSEKILEKISNGSGYLIGIDQDEDAISATSNRLKKYIDDKKLIIVKNNFENVVDVLDKLKIDKINGILFDLGVSSYQFDEGERGFSYNHEAVLDMRMDKDNPLSCKILVNTFSENDIYHIIRDYGEDNFAKNIAKHIVKARESKEIETTTELVEIIKSAIPAKMRWGEGKDKNPAKRTFQAFRIYINRELEVIDNALDGVIDRLNDGGRICVITFHSLEDKLVKDKFKLFENPCTCPKGYPCVCGKKSKGRAVNRKVIVASDEEQTLNRRSKSAKLRIFERSKDGK